MLNLKQQMIKNLVTSQLQNIENWNIEFSFDIGEKSSRYRVKNQEMREREIKIFVEEKETGQSGCLTFKM